MEISRELDHIRSELSVIHERSNNNRLAIATLEAVNEQRFDHILTCLEVLQKRIEEQNNAIAKLQALADEGRTSLKTLLWIGGFIASVTAFFIMIADYISK
jgi:hypothetical protein